ncbi:MAG: taurine catabolism dioxygenase TauD, partial [Sterolibacterium sp.]
MAPPDRSPFDLNNPAAYAAWRERKLATAPTTLAELLVEIGDPHDLSCTERHAILERVQRANMAIYTSNT